MSDQLVTDFIEQHGIQQQAEIVVCHACGVVGLYSIEAEEQPLASRGWKAGSDDEGDPVVFCSAACKRKSEAAS